MSPACVSPDLRQERHGSYEPRHLSELLGARDTTLVRRAAAPRDDRRCNFIMRLAPCLPRRSCMISVGFTFGEQYNNDK